MIKAMTFPENIDRLLDEEEIRRRSKAAIEASPTLLHHLNMVECAMDTANHHARNHQHESNDELTVQLLSVRLFNSMAGAVQQMMRGYYQNSVMLMRDILEVGFLLSYFGSKPELISVWNTCTEDDRNRKFSAFTVRNFLDDRDGFTEKKRMEHYKLLCKMGAHASAEGFAMLRPEPGGLAHCGPFFAAASLDATLAELAKVATSALGSLGPLLPARGAADAAVAVHYMETQAEWLDEFFGLGSAAPIRAALARLKALKTELG